MSQKVYVISLFHELKIIICVTLTMATESRAAVAKISAQDTTGPLHTLSTAALISSTTENPLIELIFG
jgi:hypothetical protein